MESKFQKLPSPDYTKSKAAVMSENIKKNRFQNIYPCKYLKWVNFIQSITLYPEYYISNVKCYDQMVNADNFDDGLM